MRVRDRLFEENPFAGLDVSGVDPDRQGWGSDHPIISECIEKIRPQTIAEVGVWKGRCALNMVRYCRGLDLDAEVICIDTWLGSQEHWLRRDNPHFYHSLSIKNGFPRIYWTFLRNVVDENAQDYITPMPMPSETASYVLQELNVKLDLVHVDAGHEYEAVSADLRRYWSLLRPGGILIGDDYVPSWPGVRRAADEFAKSVDRDLRIEGRKYLLVR